MSPDPGEIVRRRGETGGIYRVRNVGPDGSVTCFGGPLRQWRSFWPRDIKPASAADRRRLLLIDEQERPLRQAIRPARALRLVRG